MNVNLYNRHGNRSKYKGSRSQNKVFLTLNIYNNGSGDLCSMQICGLTMIRSPVRGPDWTNLQFSPRTPPKPMPCHLFTAFKPGDDRIRVPFGGTRESYVIIFLNICRAMGGKGFSWGVCYKKKKKRKPLKHLRIYQWHFCIEFQSIQRPNSWLFKSQTDF